MPAVPITDGVADVASLAEQAERGDGFFALSFTDSDRLATHLTTTVLRPGARYTQVRYQINISGLRGLLDRVRTKGIRILHEIRDLAPESDEPPAKATDQAVNVVVNGGKHHQINVTTNQAQHGNASSTTTTAGPGDNGIAGQALRWTKRQTSWTIASVVLTVRITSTRPLLDIQAPGMSFCCLQQPGSMYRKLARPPPHPANHRSVWEHVNVPAVGGPVDGRGLTVPVNDDGFPPDEFDQTWLWVEYGGELLNADVNGIYVRETVAGAGPPWVYRWLPDLAGRA